MDSKVLHKNKVFASTLYSFVKLKGIISFSDMSYTLDANNYR